MSALSERRLTPSEGNKAWEPFWAFMRAIDRGDSTVRKTKKGAKGKLIFNSYSLLVDSLTE